MPRGQGIGSLREYQQPAGSTAPPIACGGKDHFELSHPASEIGARPQWNHLSVGFSWLESAVTNFGWTGHRVFHRFPGGLPVNPAPGYLGFTDFGMDVVEGMAKAAKKNGGICGFWMWFNQPCVWLADPELRRTVIDEAKMGTVTPAQHTLLASKFDRNGLMGEFLLAKPVGGREHLHQRATLLTQLYVKADALLPGVINACEDFLPTLCGKRLRPEDLAAACALRIATGLPVFGAPDLDLGLAFDAGVPDDADRPRNMLQKIMRRVAGYLVSEVRDPAFEEEVFAYVTQCVFRPHYRSMVETPGSFLAAVFKSKGHDPLPATWEAFCALPPKTQRSVAWNWTTVMFGALIHTTSASLGWLFAQIEQDEELKRRLSLRADEQGGLDDSELELLILGSVARHPIFAIETYMTATDVDIGDGRTLPPGVLLFADLLTSSRVDPRINSQAAFEAAAKEKTTAQLIANHDQMLPSFSGTSQKNHPDSPTRICPGRRFALKEQAAIVRVVYRDYDVKSAGITNEPEPGSMPVYLRRRTGTMTLAARESDQRQTPM